MEETLLAMLREVVIQLVRDCEDEDLLDLLAKLLAAQQPLPPQ